MFIWFALHDKIMKNINHVLRHIADDPSCKICGAPEEDLVHVLRDCPQARFIWMGNKW